MNHLTPNVLLWSDESAGRRRATRCCASALRSYTCAPSISIVPWSGDRSKFSRMVSRIFIKFCAEHLSTRQTALEVDANVTSLGAASTWTSRRRICRYESLWPSRRVPLVTLNVCPHSTWRRSAIGAVCATGSSDRWRSRIWGHAGLGRGRQPRPDAETGTHQLDQAPPRVVDVTAALAANAQQSENQSPDCLVASTSISNGSPATPQSPRRIAGSADRAWRTRQAPPCSIPGTLAQRLRRRAAAG